MNSRRKKNVFVEIGIALITLSLFGFLFLHHDRAPMAASVAPLPANDINQPQQAAPAAQRLADPLSGSGPKAAPLRAHPMVPEAASAANQGVVETHRKIAAGLNERFRTAIREQYGALFKQLNLPADVQGKVVAILTQPQTQMEQEAFEAGQTGRIPSIPSPSEVAARQATQNQQLSSILGQTGFEQLRQYQATIPDRVVIDQMNQEGANLSEGQSQQLLQVLTDARQQIVVQSSISRNLASMPPDQALPIIQQQQALLRQTVVSRSQGILTPAQSTTLQGALSATSIGPKAK